LSGNLNVIFPWVNASILSHVTSTLIATLQLTLVGVKTVKPTSSALAAALVTPPPLVVLSMVVRLLAKLTVTKHLSSVLLLVKTIKIA